MNKFSVKIGACLAFLFTLSIVNLQNQPRSLALDEKEERKAPPEKCLLLQDEAWRQSRHYVTKGIDQTYIKDNILSINHILASNTNQLWNKTLCNPASRFRSSPNANLRLWIVRLVYLAFHYHQHISALEEAKAGCTEFQCPDAKFIIVPLKPHGLGANVRTGIVPALMAGLVTNRVVVLVNDSPTGHDDVRKAWPLASCDRKDAQCSFLPLSPCTLSLDDIENAHVFTNRGDFRRVLKQGRIPPDMAKFNDKKVWLFRKATGHTVQLPEIAVERLQNYSRSLVSHVTDERRPILDQAIERMGEEDPPREGLNFVMANLKVHHALVFYSIRPNRDVSSRLNHIQNTILGNGFDSSQSVGLPVRGTDKCNKESECLSFEEHMKAAAEAWSRHQNSSDWIHSDGGIHPTIVFTTESRAIVSAQQSYVKSAADSDLVDFRFLTNPFDVTPDTGFFADASRSGNLTADEAMVSSLSSLQTQLLARTTVGNCCSHYHHLLNDFLSEGCGATEENDYMCLQESSNPELRVCCAWHSDCNRKQNKPNVSVE